MPQLERQSHAQGVASASNACSACKVRNSSLCGALSESEVLELNAIATRKRLAPGQTHVI